MAGRSVRLAVVVKTSRVALAEIYAEAGAGGYHCEYVVAAK